MFSTYWDFIVTGIHKRNRISFCLHRAQKLFYVIPLTVLLRNRTQSTAKKAFLNFYFLWTEIFSSHHKYTKTILLYNLELAVYFSLSFTDLNYIEFMYDMSNIMHNIYVFSTKRV